MSAVNPTLAEAITAGIRAALAHVHTHLPGEVVAYNPVTNTAEIKPVVKAQFFDREGVREYDELPTIPAVPIVWPRSGGFVARMPLQPGDFVWLAFSEASLAEWRTTGQTSEPVDARRFSLGYPYAFPGAFPDVALLAPTDAVHVASGAMIVGEDGGKQLRIGPLGVEFATSGVSAIMPVALAPPLVAAATAAAAAATADAATGATLNAALTAIGAALTALAATPGTTPGAVTAVGTANTAIGTANAAQAASATAATAAATAQTAAASSAASTLMKSL